MRLVAGGGLRLTGGHLTLVLAVTVSQQLPQQRHIAAAAAGATEADACS